MPTLPDLRPDSEEDFIFSIGELVDGVYEILQLLGSGGMGQVFEALDHLLNRRVAIKAVWPNPLAPPLRNEARALAAFSHPSLVMVHTLGQHGGIDYLVMERIYGVSLSEHLAARDGTPLSVEDAMSILLPCAEGLAVVHRAGLVHRDVKPDNIMLTPDGRIVLMDFGLVLPEFHIDAQDTVAGSPPYMAPEALSNEMNSGQGHLVDIFGLGVLAFELLTGKRPYQGDTVAEVFAAQEALALDIGKRLDLPAPLRQLVEEMLSQDPAARTQSAEAVVWQLRSIRDGMREGARTSLVSKRKARPRLLIVDDDADLVRVLSFYVRDMLQDVELRTASDGEEALTLVREEEPDVMLLDLHMPRMNGIELCMQLRGDRIAQDCAIISVSAGAQEHDVQLMHHLGIHHFVEKGSSLKSRLRDVLGEVLGEALLK